MEERRVEEHWPCHGPVPWPNGVSGYREAMLAWMNELGRVGTRIVELIALGLGLQRRAISAMCEDGWHRMQTVGFLKG